MVYLVTIPLIDYSFFVGDVEGDPMHPLESREGWEVQEGVWIEQVPNLYEWLDGTPAPEATLCQSLSDLKHYKVFNHPSDVPTNEFRPTGRNYGGSYSRKRWDRFSREGLSALLKFYEVPDTDAPEAMENAMRSIRGAR